MRFLYKPDRPFESTLIEGRLEGTDLSINVLPAERQHIEQLWPSAVERGAYSTPGALGSLWDSSNPTDLRFRPTDYKSYFAACASRDVRLHEAMRVSSVAAAVRTRDEKYVIHRRPTTATHLPSVLDCSAAGLCHAGADGRLDFVGALREKLRRELSIDTPQVEAIHGTGIHSAPHPSWSGMITFLVEANATFDELRAGANPKFAQDLAAIEETQLLDYVVDHLCRRGDLLADGAATLLAAMPHVEFVEAVTAVRNAGATVYFGRICDGRFVEEP